MSIENGVIQGTVLSMTLFLVAMASIYKRVEEPTRILGYADYWVVYTSQRTPRMAENKLQKAANKIVKWTKETSFNISVEKTKAMLIHDAEKTEGL
jgi:hypothetical protein